MPFLSLGRIAAVTCVLGLVLAGAGLYFGGPGVLLLLAGVVSLGLSAWLISQLRAKFIGSHVQAAPVEQQPLSEADRADRLDLGERFVVAGVCTPLGLGMIFSVIGTGLQFNALTLILGLLTPVVLIWLGNGLYQGQRRAVTLATAWVGLNVLLGLVFVGLAVSAPKQLASYGLPGVGGTWMLALSCLSQWILGLFLFLPKSVPVFMAAKRGEQLAVAQPAPQGDLFAVNDGKQVVLRPEAKPELSSVARYLLMTGMGLLGLAGLCVMGGALLLYFTGSGWSLILVAVLAFLLGNILRTPAEDLQYLTQATGPQTPHLTNTINGLGVFCKSQVGVGVILALVLLIKIAF